jgi:alkylation response protein AidB-like acyl-CoA dehydrogenase
MTQELQEIRGLARDFAAAELRPHAEAWDAAGAMGHDVAGKLAELGFFAMLVPEESGGMGFDAATWIAALEELAWGEPAAALLVAHSVLAADYVARFGSDEVKESWLGALAAGESTGCIAFSEDYADSPVVATREGDGWRVRGRKLWVFNGADADVIIISAQDADGTALFVVPSGNGVELVQRHNTLGFRAVSLVDIDLDVLIPDAARLDSGAGDALAQDTLGRLSAAAIALGIAQAALDHAVRYSGEREQFGRPIGDFEGIQRKLAEMATRITGARCILERAAAEQEHAMLTAMAKLAAAECAMYVTTEAVQVYGGYGYMRDYPVEKLMRDAKATEIMHGTNEVQRVRIAESLRA